MRVVALLMLTISMLVAAPCRAGDMARWEAVLDRMTAQHAAVSACRADPERCIPEAKLAIVLLSESGIGFVNRSVNQIVRRKDESVDVWSDPFATLSQRAGDCEDYAILKFFLLREMGYAPVLLIVGRNGQHHMVVSIRSSDTGWVVLDNLTNTMVPFSEYARFWKVEKAL